MPDFDTVIQSGTVSPAAAGFPANIGIKDGRIAALRAALGQGRDEINTSGRLVLPSGVDAHCHLDQPSINGSVCADDFRSGTTAAVCGGTTTVIPFAVQMKGQSLRAATGGIAPDARFKADPTPFEFAARVNVANSRTGLMETGHPLPSTAPKKFGRRVTSAVRPPIQRVPLTTWQSRRT